MKLFNWFKKKEEPQKIDVEEHTKEESSTWHESAQVEDPKAQFLNELEALETQHGDHKPFSKLDIDALDEVIAENRNWLRDLKVEIEEYSQEFEAIKSEPDLMDGNPLNSARGLSLDRAIGDRGYEVSQLYMEIDEDKYKAKALQMKLNQYQEMFQTDWSKSNQPQPPSKTPFTKDDVKVKEGEFDKLQDLLKDDKLHADMAAADFYHGGHSQEDAEYGASYDDMRCANYCVDHRENEISETQHQINHMTQTLDDNHNKLNADCNKSNEMEQGFEPER